MRTLASEIPESHTMQFFVDERDELLEGAVIPVPPDTEQVRNVTGRLLGGTIQGRILPVRSPPPACLWKAQNDGRPCNCIF